MIVLDLSSRRNFSMCDVCFVVKNYQPLPYVTIESHQESWIQLSHLQKRSDLTCFHLWLFFLSAMWTEQYLKWI